MPATQTITAVILTLNEEVNIERCLQSVSWASETVVIDSDSSDRTVERAARNGARVIQHRQLGTYRNADQRNWALEHAQIESDWVLFVDADEVITPDLAAEIRRCVQLQDGPAAYQLAPKYLFWGRWMRRCMRYPSWHDRLLRRGAVSFEGGVWEGFCAGTSAGRITPPYLHFGNSKGFEDWLERHGRYSSWDAGSIVAYLDTREPAAFATTRRLRSRKLAARFWKLRPLGRFVVMYVVRRGFLDGPEAFVFCLRYALYEYMTVEKVMEIRRVNRGRPL